jgi:hypothetical protein
VWGVLVVFLAFTIFLLVEQARELIFYMNIGWDFSQDSNICLRNYYWGEGSDPQDLMSNKERVLFGRPFIIFIMAAFCACLTSIVLYPANWVKETMDSGVTYHYIESPNPDAH